MYKPNHCEIDIYQRDGVQRLERQKSRLFLFILLFLLKTGLHQRLHYRIPTVENTKSDWRSPISIRRNSFFI